MGGRTSELRLENEPQTQAMAQALTSKSGERIPWASAERTNTRPKWISMLRIANESLAHVLRGRHLRWVVVPQGFVLNK